MPTDIFDSNQTLLSHINEFNKKYAKYQYCNRNNNIPISLTCDPNNINCCTSDDKDTDNIRRKLDQIVTDINDLKLYIGSMGNSNNIFDNDFNYDNIVIKKKELETIRNDLDRKIMNIYKTPGSEFDDMHIQNTYVTYTSILITILATSMLYVTFTRLS